MSAHRHLFPSRRAVLASLSASAAAVAATTEAEAQIITTPVDVTVGYNSGDLSSYTFTGLPGTTILFIRDLLSGTYGTVFARQILGKMGTAQGTLRKTNVYLARGAAGLTFSQAGNGAAGIGTFVRANGGGASFNGNNTTQIYTAFRFKDSNRGGAFGYGYITGTIANSTLANVGYHIDSVTYEASGAQITTGQTPAAVPEPSQLALGAMAALAGGAFAVRKWKADRASAATLTEAAPRA